MIVSWPLAARAAATAAAAVAALALLPSLLRAPEPPPLDPDVGLLGAADQPPAMPVVEPDRKAERDKERAVKGGDRAEVSSGGGSGETPRREKAPKGAACEALEAGPGSRKSRVCYPSGTRAGSGVAATLPRGSLATAPCASSGT